MRLRYRRLGAAAAAARGVLLVLLASLLLPAMLAACGGGSSSSGQGTPGSILDVAYSLQRDDGGKAPGKDTTLTLFFEPKGKAILLAASDSDMLAHHGTYSYGGGKLTLKFTADDFHPDTSFPLDLGRPQVQMPFQVFSANKGTSTWTRTLPELAEGATMAAYALVSDDSPGCLTKKQILEEAAAYVTGRTGVQPQVDGDLSDPTITPDQSDSCGGGSSGGGQPTDTPTDTAAPTDTPTDSGAGTPTPTDSGTGMVPGGGEEAARLPGRTYPDAGQLDAMFLAPSGLRLAMRGGPMMDVELFNEMNGTYGMPLNLGPAANDPRTHISPKRPGNGADDVGNRNALLVAPFKDDRSFGFSFTGNWHMGTIVYGQVTGPTEDTAQKALESDGFTVKRLDNTAASVEGIYNAVTSPTPGVVEFMTHGSTAGDLMTADHLGARASEALAAYPGYIKKLQADGLSGIGNDQVDILVYAGWSQGAWTQYFAGLRPGFWTWAEGHGANFGKSLVVVGACYTDDKPDLREAIKAKAYLAFNVEVNVGLVDAVTEYVPDLMVRPSFTAEEAYYNAIRIAHTHKYAYKQDKDFDQTGARDDFTKEFDGWGWDGSKMVQYMGNGWLDPGKVDGGQIWYLTFAARWGQDVVQGAQNLMTCWNSWWQNGQTGGLASPFCQNANAGSAPKADEVGYATYLITGNAQPSYSGTKVPRLTLRDGG